MINLCPSILRRILNNEELLKSLENIESFRALRKHTSAIINAEDAIKKARREGKSKSSVSQEKRQMKKQRKQITEVLL